MADSWRIERTKLAFLPQKTLLEGMFCLELGLLQMGLPVITSRVVHADNEAKK
jgi:hypothetical protein